MKKHIKFLAAITAVFLLVMPLFCAPFTASADYYTEYPNSDLLTALPTSAVPQNATDLKIKAKAAVLMEPHTGKVLYTQNPDEKLAPASITKVMSLILVMEAISTGKLTLDMSITCSESAAEKGGSQIWLEAGEVMTIDELLKATVVYSANDACCLLAETVAGSEAEFCVMMNKKAKELGLTNTNFKNPHGLDEVNHYSSARDMSKIARELVKHEKVLEYTSIYETYLRENLDTKVWLVNTNKLVRFYSGVDGLKTGYTKTAGYCLTATAKKNNMRLITVVMGESDSTTRNSETSEMLDYGFAQYELETMLSKDSILGKTLVDKGTKRTVEVVSKEDISFLTKKIDPKINATYKLDIDTIKAPVKVGDVVGKLYVYDGEKKIREVDLTVKEDIEKENLFNLFIRNLEDIIIGNMAN